MVVGKMKIVYRGIHLMLSDDGKESNTAKVVNTATEFNEFITILFSYKVKKLDSYR